MNLRQAIERMDECRKAQDMGDPFYADAHAYDVIRAHAVDMLNAPVAKVKGKVGEFATLVVSHDMVGKSVRLVCTGGDA